MKKSIFNLMTILMVAMMSICFVSCGDDDDDDNNGIAGTWVDDYTIMELGKDGSYYAYDPRFPEDGYRKGTYTYNSSQKLMSVSIVAVPGQNSAYKRTYLVQTLTSTTLVLIETQYGDTHYYTRK